MKSIAACVLQGHGVASGHSTTDQRFPLGTITMQQPFFKEQGLDLSDYFHGDFVSGTLNLSVVPHTYTIQQPEYVLRNIKWTDIFPPENFFLSPARLFYRDTFYRALIYVPDPATKPDHFQAPSTIEVIAQTIPVITYGDTLDLWYNPAAISVD